MIKLKTVLNEGLKKSDFSPVIKRIEKAAKLIKQADDELYAARSYVYQKLEGKAEDADISQKIQNLKGSISDGMRYMLRDPLKKANMIKDQISSIIRKL